MYSTLFTNCLYAFLLECFPLKIVCTESSSTLSRCEEQQQGLYNYKDTKPQISSLLVFNRVIDWRYSQTCWYFRPALWSIAPLTFSLVSIVFYQSNLSTSNRLNILQGNQVMYQRRQRKSNCIADCIRGEYTGTAYFISVELWFFGAHNGGFYGQHHKTAVA
jgi:hypothetical protein